MDISTEALRAFIVVTESRSFTKGAQILGLTQSALSQKISRLESQLETTLFIRGLEGITLTSSGEKLLLFARQQLQFQEDFLREFQTDDKKLAGHLRIAGFSSIMRSIIIPKLSPWLRENRGVSVEFSSYEVHELVGVLKTNKADMIITDHHLHLHGVEEKVIGEEEYVEIESKKYKNVPDIYLDHYPLDNATESYFTHLGMKFNKKRSYMGDVYGILDGVAQGLGKAIMSRHLVEEDKRFKMTIPKKRYLRPIILSYFEQSYYPAIQQEVLSILAGEEH